PTLGPEWSVSRLVSDRDYDEVVLAAPVTTASAPGLCSQLVGVRKNGCLLTFRGHLQDFIALRRGCEYVPLFGESVAQRNLGELPRLTAKLRAGGHHECSVVLLVDLAIIDDDL